jgi:predicted lipase
MKKERQPATLFRVGKGFGVWIFLGVQCAPYHPINILEYRVANDRLWVEYFPKQWLLTGSED